MDGKALRDMMDSLDIEQTERLLQDVDLRQGGAAKRKTLRAARAKTGGRKKRRWPIAAAACLCALLLAAAVFPGTATAIADFFTRQFSVDTYLSKPEQQRQTQPDMEQVIERPQTTGDYKVYTGAELERLLDQDGLLDGQEADWRSDEKYAWLQGLRPEISEVLYDGSIVAITGKMYTDHPLAFYSTRMEVAEEEGRISFLEADLVHDGQATGGLLELQMDSDTYSNGEDGMQVADAESILAQGYVPFYASFQQPLPDGEQAVKLMLVINDYEVHDMQRSGTVAMVEVDVDINADAGNASKQVDEAGQVAVLQGEAAITHYKYDTTSMMSVDGYEMHLKRLEKTQTGMLAYFEDVLPEQLQGGEMPDWYWRPMFMMVVDGEDRGIAYMQGNGDMPSAYTVVIPLLPSDLEQAESFELVPMLKFQPDTEEERKLGEKIVYEVLDDGREIAEYFTAFRKHPIRIELD